MSLTPDQEASLQTLIDGTNDANTNLDGILKWTRRGAVLLAAAILVVGAYAYQGQRTADRAQHSANRAAASLAEYKAKTQEARVNSCKQDVLKAKEQGKIEKGNERARRKQSPEAEALTAQVLKQLGISQAQADRFTNEQLANFDVQVDKAHRLRDCTKQGIADYLSGHGGYLPVTTSTTKP